VSSLPNELEYIVKLYAQTKSLILKAEELDPELRSCVPIIKELRDSFDHLMRYIGDSFAQTPQGDSYKKQQLDKAIGHVYRAAYDALDSLSICLKTRIHKALDERSTETISVVFPLYYKTHITKLSEIDGRIEESRKHKDIGKKYNADDLNNYMGFLVELENICKEAESRIPDMVAFDQKKAAELKNNNRFTINVAFWSAIIGAVIAFLLDFFFKK